MRWHMISPSTLCRCGVRAKCSEKRLGGALGRYRVKRCSVRHPRTMEQVSSLLLSNVQSLCQCRDNRFRSGRLLWRFAHGRSQGPQQCVTVFGLHAVAGRAFSIVAVSVGEGIPRRLASDPVLHCHSVPKAEQAQEWRQKIDEENF
jgi:hypothetical protein